MLISKPKECFHQVALWKREGKTIGFVPTMGALHSGHMALVERARNECDKVVVSIFVNPLQFGKNEDYHVYPRKPDEDVTLLKDAGVDLVFVPAAVDMYPEGFATKVVVGGPAQHYEGVSRPGHFEGVATVLIKLFNIIPADKAYFGLKDAQQVAVVKRMVQDLNVPVGIVVHPVVRDTDGLALSSRNVYLEQKHVRDRANVIYRALMHLYRSYKQGIREANVLKGIAIEVLSSESDFILDYIDIVDPDRFVPLEDARDGSLVVVAGRLAGVRLIDALELYSG